MAIIQLTPELLKAKANDLRALKSTHDEAMTKMRSLIRGMNEVWKGKSQDALVNKYESMQPTFNSFSQMLEDYARLMDASADRFTVADEEGASQINSFGV